jgi:dTDP-4-amino-4,6-dideoxygalactose transaminase
MRLHGISHDAWDRYSASGSWYYQVEEAGYKYNLTDIQSAIGIVQLAKCDEMNRGRQRIAARYSEAFATINALEVPAVVPDRESSWHLYVLRLNLEQLRIGRDRFIEELEQRGVSASMHFIPLHLQPYYQNKFSYRVGDYPHAEHEYTRCLSLPIFPGMSDEEVEIVIGAVLDIVKHRTK